VEGDTTKQRFSTDEHFPNEHPSTSFTDVHMTKDINDNNISTSKTIQDNAIIDSFEEIIRNWNMEMSMLNNKDDELSEEIKH
jgi:hypothetical protein